MDNLSTLIGVLAPIIVVVIIAVGLRAIMRADQQENDALAVPDTVAGGNDPRATERRPSGPAGDEARE